MTNRNDISFPVTERKVRERSAEYRFSTQLRANSFGTPRTRLSSYSATGCVFFNQVSKLGRGNSFSIASRVLYQMSVNSVCMSEGPSSRRVHSSQVVHRADIPARGVVIRRCRCQIRAGRGNRRVTWFPFGRRWDSLGMNRLPDEGLSICPQVNHRQASNSELCRTRCMKASRVVENTVKSHHTGEIKGLSEY